MRGHGSRVVRLSANDQAEVVSVDSDGMRLEWSLLHMASDPKIVADRVHQQAALRLDGARVVFEPSSDEPAH